MKIRFHKNFDKQFKKLKANEKLKARERIKMFSPEFSKITQ